jgi:UDP-glucose:(glucosyl)LPS alpha-1,2-glucosyltransferase
MKADTAFKGANGGTELMMRQLYRTLGHRLLSKFQIIPNWIGTVDRSKIPILWLHNMPILAPKELDDPEFRSQFARIVMVSDWQMLVFHLCAGISFSECEVIHNGIYPIAEQPKADPNERIDLIFHTVPARGLSILSRAFDRIVQKFDRVHLHVYSSFDAYGLPHLDDKYRAEIDWCRNHPCVTYYGFQPHEVVRQALQRSHIFGYPAIKHETFCLAAIEAMSARNLVVAPNLGGLVETCNRWSLSYQYTEKDEEHVERFVARLSDAIIGLRNDAPGTATHLTAQKVFVDKHYNWDQQALRWKNMLNGLLAR